MHMTIDWLSYSLGLLSAVILLAAGIGALAGLLEWVTRRRIRQRTRLCPNCGIRSEITFNECPVCGEEFC